MAISSHDHNVTFDRREGDEDFPNSLISGISTFLGARVVPPVREDLESAGVKAAVLGLPWEHTNTCRPGASYGPRSIRRATEHYLSYHGEFQVDLFDELGLADCGDVAVVPGNAARTFERTERALTEIYEAGAFPILLGADDIRACVRQGGRRLRDHRVLLRLRPGEQVRARGHAPGARRPRRAGQPAGHRTGVGVARAHRR